MRRADVSSARGWDNLSQSVVGTTCPHNPETNMPENTKSNGYGLALTGAILQIATANGIIRAVLDFISSFRQLTSSSSIGDPTQLSALIGEAIITLSTSMLISLVGAILILIALVTCRYRAPWLFKFLLIVGILYLPLLPLGTLIGLGFLITAFATRKTLLAAR